MDFSIQNEIVIVKTELNIIKKNIKTNTLFLDGTDIFVEKIYLDNYLLEEKILLI